MVSKTFPRNRVFSWSLNFECNIEEGDWYIYFYDPNGVDMYKIKLDAATKVLAKGLRTQIMAWMSQSDTWAGTVEEHWQKKQVVYPETNVEEWVRV